MPLDFIISLVTAANDFSSESIVPSPSMNKAVPDVVLGVKSISPTLVHLFGALAFTTIYLEASTEDFEESFRR